MGGVAHHHRLARGSTDVVLACRRALWGGPGEDVAASETAAAIAQRRRRVGGVDHRRRTTSSQHAHHDPQDADPHDGDGESERHQQVRALAGAARCPAAAPTAGDVTVGHVTAGDVIGDHVTAGPQLAGAVVVRQTAPHASRPPWNIPPLVTDTSGRRGR